MNSSPAYIEGLIDEHTKCRYYKLTIPYLLILASLSQTNVTTFVSFSGVNLLHKSTAYIHTI